MGTSTQLICDVPEHVVHTKRATITLRSSNAFAHFFVTFMRFSIPILLHREVVTVRQLHQRRGCRCTLRE